MQADRRQELIDLQSRIRACRRCQEAFGFEPHPIVHGNPEAKIVSISQAPGASVHRLGRPFADLSGKRLRQKWYQVSEEQFYDPDLFYFTVMGHCYPGKAGRGDARPPRICYEMWTEKELRLLAGSARLFLVIGQEAASRLFPGKKLEELVFEDQQLSGTRCFVLPHPSPLNRAWFGRHPEFEQVRIPEIRRAIHEVLEDDWTEETDFESRLPVRESWQKQPGKKRTP